MSPGKQSTMFIEHNLLENVRDRLTVCLTFTLHMLSSEHTAEIPQLVLWQPFSSPRLLQNSRLIRILFKDIYANTNSSHNTEAKLRVCLCAPSLNLNNFFILCLNASNGHPVCPGIICLQHNTNASFLSYWYWDVELVFPTVINIHHRHCCAHT